MMMTKPSTLHFLVPLLLLASFCYASTSAIATTQASGNEVNTDGKVVNEDAKFKGFFHPKPIPIVKPIPVPVYKPIPKPIPIVKPIPVYKPIPKPIPIVKPIPVPVYKPIPKPIPIVKPIPVPVYKPIPKPLFKKTIPKLPHHPLFKKPFLPPFPVHHDHKPIPTP